MWRGGDGAPPARSAAAAAARLPAPGAEGRGDGAALESCVLAFWGAAGKGGEAVGTSHMSDTRIRMSEASRRLQPRETLGEKLKSPGGSSSRGRAGLGAGEARRRQRHPPERLPAVCAGPARTLRTLGCPGTRRVRGQYWDASVFFCSSLTS